MKISILTRASLVFLIAAFAICVGTARAEYLPPFDLDLCTDEAQAIVAGRLSTGGSLEIVQVIKGDIAPSQSIHLELGQYWFDSLHRFIETTETLEVIAFLKNKTGEDWNLVLQFIGLVGFHDDDVFLLEDGIGRSRLTKSKTYTKDTFLVALTGSIHAGKELASIAAEPHTDERTNQLIAFAIQNTLPQKPDEYSIYEYAHYLGKVAAALAKVTPDEQQIVLQELQKRKKSDEQATILWLVGQIPLKDDAMDAVASFMMRSNPAEVREAAMKALHAINPYRAVDYLIPYLTLDDPQLSAVLENFGSQLSYQDDRVLNIHAVEPLKQLAESMTGPDEVPVRHGYTIGAVCGMLCAYLHPKLLPILYKKAIEDDFPSSAQVLSNFYWAVGLKYPHEDKQSWEAWWKKAQPLLEGDMNLNVKADRARWMERYAQADVATQKILMDLWFFEPTVDEGALVEAAVQNDGAKSVLSELWQRHRLSPGTKKAIVQRFMTFKLVNQPPAGAGTDRTLYGASVESFNTFPFPMVAEFHNRMDVTIGDRIPTFQGDSWGISCMGYQRVDQPRTATNSAPMTSGSFSSPPQARAVVEYYESDFPYSHDILWKLHWELGPLQLSNDKR